MKEKFSWKKLLDFVKIVLFLLLILAVIFCISSCESTEEPYYEELARDLYYSSEELYGQTEEIRELVKSIYDATDDEEVVILAEEIIGYLNQIEYIASDIYKYHEEILDNFSPPDPDFDEDRDYIWTW